MAGALAKNAFHLPADLAFACPQVNANVIHTSGRAMRSERAESEAKLRVFLRLRISYNDFQQASWIASYILTRRFQEKIERLSGTRQYRIRLLWQALNSAMVVSYAARSLGTIAVRPSAQP